MPRKGESLPWTERNCKRCGEQFFGRGRASVCYGCKYTCPICGGKKRDKTSMMCLDCKYRRVKRTGMFAGENGPNWKGGRSKVPYGPGWCDNRKEKVRKRDGYRCTVCSKHQKDETGNLKLQVHHLDFSKSNHVLENLVTMCRDCHSELHRQRDIKLEESNDPVCSFGQ